MRIRCKSCGYEEQVTKFTFLKIIGGAMPIGGFWAWTAYIFAGTGFAWTICVAIIAGGVGILVFHDEIMAFFKKRFSCPKCGEKDWEDVS